MNTDALGEVELHEKPVDQSETGFVLRPRAGGWNPETFARQQIRGLVRQVFFAGGPHPVRQIVFSALEAETDIGGICRRAGETLAAETIGNVAVAVSAKASQILQPVEVLQGWPDPPREASSALRRESVRVRRNLWLVPAQDANGDGIRAATLHSRMGEIRTEFDYSVVEGPAAGESPEAAAIAQFADGIILVLSARRTRRATALQAKKSLERAQVRVLGTVLLDRMFPVPEAIYRRL